MKLEDKKIKGIMYIILSSLGFAFMQLFVKLAGDLPAVQKSFFRNLVAMFVVVIPLLRKGIPKIDMKGNWGLLILRSLLGTMGIVFNFMAVSHIPLADAAILQKLSPFIVVIFCLIFLNEKVKAYQWLAIIVAFFGVYIIIQPSGSSFNLGHIVGVGGAIMAGAAYTCLRKLGLRGVKGEFIIFFFSVFSCIYLLPAMIFNFRPMTLQQVIYLVLVGVSATIGQFGITFAYKFAAAKNIAVFEYSQIVFASLLGFFLFSEVPTLSNFIGYGIIILVGMFMTLKGAKSK